MSALKKGTYTPKAEKMKKIAHYFDVPIEYLTSGKMPDRGYYLSADIAEKAQELFENPYLTVLFDAARGSKPQDLQIAADLLKRLKDTNPNG